MALNNNFLKIFIFNCPQITAFILFFLGKIKLKNGKKMKNSEQETKLIRVVISWKSL